MNPKLAIILIIIGAGMSGIVYASSTVISDTGIITPSLTVSGTCTGCGASEGNFNSYTSILNSTVIGSHASLTVDLLVDNNGTTTAMDGQKTTLVTNTGVVISNLSVTENLQSTQPLIANSVTGVYKIVFNTPNIQIFKNNALLKTYSVTVSQFTNTNTISIAISPNGKYIAVFGEDTGAALERLILLQGS